MGILHRERMPQFCMVQHLNLFHHQYSIRPNKHLSISRVYSPAITRHRSHHVHSPETKQVTLFAIEAILPSKHKYISGFKRTEAATRKISYYFPLFKEPKYGTASLCFIIVCVWICMTSRRYAFSFGTIVTAMRTIQSTSTIYPLLSLPLR